MKPQSKRLEFPDRFDDDHGRFGIIARAKDELISDSVLNLRHDFEALSFTHRTKPVAKVLHKHNFY